jgi:hypothetical protein
MIYSDLPEVGETAPLDLERLTSALARTWTEDP